MHLTLIAILGPWGRDHSNGVLIWNVLLIVQAYLLMLEPAWLESGQHDLHDAEGSGPGDCKPPPSRVACLFVQGVILVALVAPLLERYGYWDHWTSWSLYSPHTSRVDIELHRSAIDSLDPELKAFVEADSDEDGWQALDLGGWSLESRRVPIYPQARYQLAVAAEIASRYQLKDEIRAKLRGVSDRWTGRREEQQMLGRGEIQAGLNLFWLTR